MNNRIEMWKAHRESSEKYNYYITALSVTVLAYFLGRDAALSTFELLGLYSLSISIVISIYIIRQNILILQKNYVAATEAEQGVGDADSRNYKLKAASNDIMKVLGVVQPLRGLFLVLSLILMLISKSLGLS